MRKTLKFITIIAGLLIFGSELMAQTAMVTQNLVVYQPSTRTEDAHCQITDLDEAFSNSDYNRSYYTNPIKPVNSSDPWVNSALIEYSQRTMGNRETGYNYTYPNSCLSLCAEVTCSNPARLVEGSDGSSSGTRIYTVKSGDFPIQSILFEIFKYQQNGNPYNPDSTPPIRTIALYPTDGNNICYGVGVPAGFALPLITILLITGLIFLALIPDVNKEKRYCIFARRGTARTR